MKYLRKNQITWKKKEVEEKSICFSMENLFIYEDNLLLYLDHL